MDGDDVLEERRQRHAMLQCVLGTPFARSPPFDLFDFLITCWCLVEFQELERLRYDDYRDIRRGPRE